MTETDDSITFYNTLGSLINCKLDFINDICDSITASDKEERQI